MRTSLYFNIILILPMIFTASNPVLSHTKCRVSFPGGWTEGCPHSHNMGFETNKFMLKKKVEDGGWTVAWASDISETDAIRGMVAAGVSIYSANPVAFNLWVENLVTRTIRRISQDTQRKYQSRAESLTRDIIRTAIKGKSPKEIAKRFDTVDFKAGAIRYSGRNHLEGQTVTKVWGMKPYVAFRVRGTVPPVVKVPGIKLKAGSKNLEFRRGKRWVTSSGYQLVFQNDANLVLYAPGGKPIWATGSNKLGADLFAVQADGNVVLYARSRPIWATNTNGQGSAFVIQDDGNLVVYDKRGIAKWTSGTNGGRKKTVRAAREWGR